MPAARLTSRCWSMPSPSRVPVAQLPVDVLFGNGPAEVDVPCVQHSQHRAPGQDPARPEVTEPRHRPGADQEEVNHHVEDDAAPEPALALDLLTCPLPVRLCLWRLRHARADGRWSYICDPGHLGPPFSG